jgi:hypothetical protein
MEVHKIAVVVVIRSVIVTTSIAIPLDRNVANIRTRNSEKKLKMLQSVW